MSNAAALVLLIVDDNASHQRHLRVRITLCEVLQAYSIEEAISMFKEHRERITHVLMDGNLPLTTLTKGQAPHSVSWGKGAPIVTHMRGAGFTGPIAAFTDIKDDEKALLAAGCDEAIPKSADPSYSRPYVMQFVSKPARS